MTIHKNDTYQRLSIIMTDTEQGNERMHFSTDTDAPDITPVQSLSLAGTICPDACWTAAQSAGHSTARSDLHLSPAPYLGQYMVHI